MQTFLQLMRIICSAENGQEEIVQERSSYVGAYIAVVMLGIVDLWIFSVLIPAGQNGSTLRLKCWFELFAMGIALILLVRNGMPQLFAVGLAVLLAVPIFLTPGEPLLTRAGDAGKILLCGLAALRIFEKYPRRGLRFMEAEAWGDVPGALAASVSAGILMGIVYLFLSCGTLLPDLHFSTESTQLALRAVIRSEVCFRLLFAAVGLEALGGAIYTKAESAGYLFLIAAPCSLLCSVTFFFGQELWVSVVNGLLLVVVLGLPTAILYRDKGIVPALLAHGVAAMLYFAC